MRSSLYWGQTPRFEGLVINFVSSLQPVELVLLLVIAEAEQAHVRVEPPRSGRPGGRTNPVDDEVLGRRVAVAVELERSGQHRVEVSAGIVESCG